MFTVTEQPANLATTVACPRCDQQEALTSWTAVEEAACRLIHGHDASGLPEQWPEDATGALITTECGEFYRWIV